MSKKVNSNQGQKRKAKLTARKTRAIKNKRNKTDNVYKNPSKTLDKIVKDINNKNLKVKESIDVASEGVDLVVKHSNEIIKLLSYTYFYNYALKEAIGKELKLDFKDLYTRAIAIQKRSETLRLLEDLEIVAEYAELMDEIKDISLTASNALNITEREEEIVGKCLVKAVSKLPEWYPELYQGEVPPSKDQEYSTVINIVFASLLETFNEEK